MHTYTPLELLKFKQTHTVNPSTNRRIKVGSKIYKNLERQLVQFECQSLSAVFIQQWYRYRRFRAIQLVHFGYSNDNDCINKIDPISQEPLTSMPTGSICYVKCNTQTVGYHAESIKQLLHNNTTICPLTRVTIPSETLLHMGALARAYSAIILDNTPADDSIEALVKNVFHEFTLESIYLDHTVFLSLTMSQLKNLHYEWKDMFEKNTTNQQKLSIVGQKKSFPPFTITSIDKYQRYLLTQLVTILRPNDSSLKTLVTFIMLGGLTLVCPEYSHYRHYNFDF